MSSIQQAAAALSSGISFLNVTGLVAVRRQFWSSGNTGQRLELDALINEFFDFFATDGFAVDALLLAFLVVDFASFFGETRSDVLSVLVRRFRATCALQP